MTFEEAKQKQLTFIYSPDGEGGINCYVLNWKKDTVWLRNDLWDNGSIKELFKWRRPLFETLREACDYIDKQND